MTDADIGSERIERHLLPLVEALFRPATTGRPGRVGAEIELLTFESRGNDPHAIVPIERLRAILDTDPSLAAAARFSFEPGGQLELSPPPSASPGQLVDDLRGLLARTRALFERHGIGLAALAVDPWRTTDDPPQLRTERYLAMRRHFDDIGPAGRRMMGRTASLQVCLDLLPGRAGREQWLVANLAGPALAAAFTDPTAAPSDTRLALWQAVDPSRTGRTGAHVDGEHPERGYLALAIAAEAIPMRRGNDANHELPFRTSMEAWIRSGRGRPDPDDLAHHLSTLFPPVRPRGYLEIRYLDVQPDAWLAVPITLLSTLLHDESARHDALDVLGDDPGPLADWWRRAAADPTDTGLRRSAFELFDIAARRARAVTAWAIPPDGPELLEEYVDLVRRPRAALVQDLGGGRAHATIGNAA